MFYFVVKHLRFLARVPGLPHLFDAALLAGTFLCHRQRIDAIESLEAKLTTDGNVFKRTHRFGGIEFAGRNGSELGHIHGNGLLDVKIPLSIARRFLAENKVRAHHIFPNSRWVSFQLETERDIPFALQLLKLSECASAQRNRSSPFSVDQTESKESNQAVEDCHSELTVFPLLGERDRG